MRFNFKLIQVCDGPYVRKRLQQQNTKKITDLIVALENKKPKIETAKNWIPKVKFIIESNTKAVDRLDKSIDRTSIFGESNTKFKEMMDSKIAFGTSSMFEAFLSESNQHFSTLTSNQNARLFQLADEAAKTMQQFKKSIWDETEFLVEQTHNMLSLKEKLCKQMESNESVNKLIIDLEELTVPEVFEGIGTVLSRGYLTKLNEFNMEISEKLLEVIKPSAVKKETKPSTPVPDIESENKKLTESLRTLETLESMNTLDLTDAPNALKRQEIEKEPENDEINIPTQALSVQIDALKKPFLSNNLKVPEWPNLILELVQSYGNILQKLHAKVESYKTKHPSVYAIVQSCTNHIEIANPDRFELFAKNMVKHILTLPSKSHREITGELSRSLSLASEYKRAIGIVSDLFKTKFRRGAKLTKAINESFLQMPKQENVVYGNVAYMRLHEELLGKTYVGLITEVYLTELVQQRNLHIAKLNSFIPLPADSSK